MMNSITWQPRTTSLDAVNQLHVYADPQRSPLVALFNAVKESSQLDSKKVDVNPAVADAAKRVAARQLSTRSRKVADAVLNSQSENINALEDKVNDYLAGPLEAEFETLLQLIDAQINPKSDLSLQRYLERVTTVKQRLIQMTASSDTGGAARTAVQGVLNGGDNEFLDGIQYARLIEAGVVTDCCRLHEMFLYCRLIPYGIQLPALLKKTSIICGQVILSILCSLNWVADIHLLDQKSKFRFRYWQNIWMLTKVHLISLSQPNWQVF